MQSEQIIWGFNMQSYIIVSMEMFTESQFLESKEDLTMIVRNNVKY